MHSPTLDKRCHLGVLLCEKVGETEASMRSGSAQLLRYPQCLEFAEHAASFAYVIIN